MTIRFLCPSGHHLSVAESHAGKSARCAVCQQTTTVPAAGDGPPPLLAKPLPPPLVVARAPVDVPRESPLPPVVPLDALPVVLGPPPSAPPMLKARAVTAPPALVPPPMIAPARESEPVAVIAPTPAIVPAIVPAVVPLVPAVVPLVPAVVPLAPAVVPLAPAPARIESPWSDPVLPAPVPLPTPAPAVEPLVPLAPRRRSKREAMIAATPADGDSDTVAAVAEPSPRPRRRAAKGPKTVPADVYLPDARHVAQVKWLAAMLGAALLFSLLPLLTKTQLNPATAPGWARAVLLLALLQAVYVAWMLAAPDWASAWVVMLVFAVAAALYGAATAVTIATPADKPLPLGLDAVRAGARSWCGAVLAVMTLATYLCGRIAAHWRRDRQRGAAARAS